MLIGVNYVSQIVHRISLGADIRINNQAPLEEYMKEAQFEEFLHWSSEPEIVIYSGNFEITIANNNIRIAADISGAIGRLADDCSIPLDKFIDACNRLKAEVESHSNGVANKVINPTSK